MKYVCIWPMASHCAAPQNQIQIFFSALIEGTDWILTLDYKFLIVGELLEETHAEVERTCTLHRHIHIKTLPNWELNPGTVGYYNNAYIKCFVCLMLDIKYSLITHCTTTLQLDILISCETWIRLAAKRSPSFLVLMISRCVLWCTFLPQFWVTGDMECFYSINNNFKKGNLITSVEQSSALQLFLCAAHLHHRDRSPLSSSQMRFWEKKKNIWLASGSKHLWPI